VIETNANGKHYLHYTLKDHQGNLTATISGKAVERPWHDNNNS